MFFGKVLLPPSGYSKVNISLEESTFSPADCVVISFNFDEELMILLIGEREYPHNQKVTKATKDNNNNNKYAQIRSMPLTHYSSGWEATA